MPELAVVIVNYNTPALTARCVESVASTPSVDLEVIVVDNGSTDDSVDVLSRRTDCRIVPTGRNGGFGHGVNAGVAATDAPYLLVMNSDTEARPGAVEALLEALKSDPALGLVAPALEHADGTLQSSAYRRFPTPLSAALEVAILPGYVSALLPRLPHATAVDPEAVARGEGYVWVTCAAAAIARTWWDRVGPFDERFFLYYEDTDWQRRLRRAGGRIRIVSRARVLHLQRAGDPVAAVVAAAWIDSALRFFALDGVSRRRVAPLLRVGIVIAWATTWATAARPGGRPKAREMRRRLAAVRKRISAC